MPVYFAVAFFQRFREKPPAKRAVRTLVIDMLKEIPGTGTGTSTDLLTKTRVFSSYMT